MSQPTATGTSAPRWRKPVLYILFFAIVAALIWNQLPRDVYSTDLTRVGAGRPALVVTVDIRYAGGAAVLASMNEVREEYEKRVDFMVARVGIPEGRAFAEQYRTFDGTVLLFGGDGKQVARLQHPISAADLRQALDAAFGS